MTSRRQVFKRPVPIRRIVLAVVFASLVWLAVGAVQLVWAVGDMRAARADAGVVRTLDVAADMEEASARLSAAHAAFARAAGRLRGGGVAPYRLVPRLTDAISVAADLASAGELAAAAGDEVVSSVAGLPGGLGSVAPSDGALPVERLHDLAGPFGRAEALLTRSLRHLANAEGVAAPLPSPLVEARRDLRGLLPDAADTVGRAAALTRTLPDFLGMNGTRRYLFVAQNPAETRGTGGFIGAYSILTVEDGRLDFSGFEEIQTLPAFPWTQVVPPSGDYARRYSRYGGAGFWHNINMTPDFPTAARAMLSLYEKGTGDRLDGVIATDPFALQALLEVSRPVDVPGFGTVTADEVVDVVSNRAHAELANSGRRKRLLGAVSVGAFRGLMSGARDPLAALRSLVGAVDKGHILLRSADPEIQASFVRAGVAGRFGDPEGDFLAVIANAGSAAKLDYFIQRTVSYEVELRADGSAASTMTLQLHNDAPTQGVSARVIGPNARGLKAGQQRLILSTYTGDGAILGSTRGNEQAIDQDHELGHPVFTTVTKVAGGRSKELLMTWRRTNGWERAGGGGRYHLTVAPQTTLRPTRLNISVAPPPGLRVVAVSDAARVVDGRVVFEGVLDRLVRLEIELRRENEDEAVP